MRNSNLYILFFIFFALQISAQKKGVPAYRIESSIKIDGKLDEEVWKNKEFATDFIEFFPNNGQKEKSQSPTKVKVLYDDVNLYFGLEMQESKMDSLNTRLSKRDQISDTEDWVLLLINPFNDQQQYFEFGVSAAGVQFDAFGTQNTGEDFSWNAIWNSAVHIADDRWFVEIAIPYSALRFPKGYDKDWSLNIIRNYAKNRKKFSWERVDNKIGNTYQYNGSMQGIEGITPPTRLFFIPYLSNYLGLKDGKTTNTVRGGLDLNFGINDSFTLDAVLIPDFGQTGFDAVRYVFGPFEQQFSDQRPFFTEGTDLLNKGGLFYSRRIGAAPTIQPTLNSDEEAIDYPSETQLLNALKVSGRNKNGLGIGVLNAITAKEEVTIVNKNNQSQRKEIVNPLTNYNVLVLDKRFKESASSVSFTNTNTTRNGSFTDANASAFIVDWYDKENKYNVYTRARYSQRFNDENKKGYQLNGGWYKVFGKYRYGINADYTSKDFDINDLGINFYTNYYSGSGYVSYRILESTDKFNSLNMSTGINSRFDKSTHKPYYNSMYFNFNSTNKKNNYNGFGFNASLTKSYDFYEPRKEGRYSLKQNYYSAWYYNSPNYSNKFVIDKNIYGGIGSFKNAYNFGFEFEPIYRPSDNLLLRFSLGYSYQSNDRGYVATNQNNIIYGDRNIRTMTTNINGEYYFNPLTSLGLNFRHYYTNADYQKFYNLNLDGSYQDNNTYNQNKDFTFNTWNMDLKFSWWFAPGSQMEILYRNTLDNYNNFAENNIGTNYKNLFDEPLNQVLSLRLTYFLDYNKAKAFFKKRKTDRTSQNEARIKNKVSENNQRSLSLNRVNF